MIIELARHRQKENEKNLIRAFSRLKKIISSRYFCKTEFLNFNKTEQKDKLTNLVHILIATRQHVTIANNSYFPVLIPGKIQYAVKVHPTGHLDKMELDEIQALVEVTIQPILVQNEKKEQLLLKEKNIQINSSEFNNVIPLKKNQSTPLSFQFNFQDKKDKKIKFPNFIFIQTLTKQDGHRMAMEMHEKSNSTAFIRYFDLDEKAREALLSENPLGTLTIYVPEIKDITKKEQEALYKFVDEKKETNVHFIFSTIHSFKHLIHNKEGHLPLLENYRKSFIYLDKPFSYFKNNNKIENFFSNLSHH